MHSAWFNSNILFSEGGAPFAEGGWWIKQAVLRSGKGKPEVWTAAGRHGSAGRFSGSQPLVNLKDYPSIIHYCFGSPYKYSDSPSYFLLSIISPARCVCCWLSWKRPVETMWSMRRRWTQLTSAAHQRWSANIWWPSAVSRNYRSRISVFWLPSESSAMHRRKKSLRPRGKSMLQSWPKSFCLL